MKPNPEILNELESVAPKLIGIDRFGPFKAPVNYFLFLSDRLSIKIASIQKTYSSPSGYFESFPDRLLKRIREHEQVNSGYLEESELLNSLKNKQVFTVPEGYFDKFSVIQPQELKKSARVVPMFSKRAIWKQAAAAMITGIIGINALWMFNQSNVETSQISNGSVSSSYITATKQFKSEDQLNEGISKLSNDDIIKYLSANGSDADNENVISNITEKDLPAQDATLSDVKDINNYLNN